MNWSRRLPSIHGKAYFASCSQGPMSLDVMKAIKRYEMSIVKHGNPWEEWVAEVYRASDLFADLIGAARDEVCPHYSASSALISLLSAFKPGKRDKIITTELDYPTVGVTLQGLRSYGFRVETLRSQDGMIGLDEFEKAVDDRTLMVATFQVSALNGFRQDLRSLSKICHGNGSYLLADAYQGIGVVPLDVSKDGVDFLVAGTTKFLLGIPGAAFLYVRKELIDDLKPSAVSWFSQRDPFLFGREQMDYRPDAKRFEMGTWSVVSMYAAAAGMSIIHEVGVDKIWERVSKLRDYFRDEALAAGLEPLSPVEKPLGPTISMHVGPKSHDVELAMRRRRVITSARGPGLRFAHHFFNNKADVDEALETLSKVLKHVV
ncbi:MAG: aminotransferase class V-fold PLP-dependent enzyme [Candidatus Caldarchaeum sp.]